MILEIVVLVVAVLIGELLYRKAASAANGMRDVLTVIAGAVYLLIGVGTILFGGEIGMVIGALLVTFYFWLGRSAESRLGIRDRIANL